MLLNAQDVGGIRSIESRSWKFLVITVDSGLNVDLKVFSNGILMLIEFV